MVGRTHQTPVERYPSWWKKANLGEPLSDFRSTFFFFCRNTQYFELYDFLEKFMSSIHKMCNSMFRVNMYIAQIAAHICHFEEICRTPPI